jgi:hypothetical protein
VIRIVVGGRPLHRPDPEVAGGHAREHGTLQRRFAVHGFTGRDDREASRRWNAERVHRLADDVFAKHGTEGRTAIAAARVAGRSSSLQLDVEAGAARGDLLPEQDCPAIAKDGEIAELMACVGLRDRTGTFGQDIAAEDLRACAAGQRIGVEAQVRGKWTIERHQARLPHRRRHRLRVKDPRKFRV